MPDRTFYNPVKYSLMFMILIITMAGPAYALDNFTNRVEITLPEYSLATPYHNNQLIYQSDTHMYLFDGHSHIPLDRINRHRSTFARHIAYDPLTRTLFMNNGNGIVDTFYFPTGKYTNNVFVGSDTQYTFSSSKVMDGVFYLFNSTQVFTADHKGKVILVADTQGRYLINDIAQRNGELYLATDHGILQHQENGSTHITFSPTIAILVLSGHLIAQTQCAISTIDNHIATVIVEHVPCIKTHMPSIATYTDSGFFFYNNASFFFYDMATSVISAVGHDLDKVYAIFTSDNAMHVLRKDSLLIFSPSLFASDTVYRLPDGSSPFYTDIIFDLDNNAYIQDHNKVHIFNDVFRYLYSVSKDVYPHFTTPYITAIDIDTSANALNIYGDVVYQLSLSNQQLVKDAFSNTFSHRPVTGSVFLRNQQGLSPHDNHADNQMQTNPILLDKVIRGIRHRVLINQDLLIYQRDTDSVILSGIRLGSSINFNQRILVEYMDDKLWLAQSNHIEVYDMSDPTDPLRIPLPALPKGTNLRAIFSDEQYLFISTQSSTWAVHPSTFEIFSLTLAPSRRQDVIFKAHTLGQHQLFFSPSNAFIHKQGNNTPPDLSNISLSAYQVSTRSGYENRAYIDMIRLTPTEQLVTLYFGTDITRFTEPHISLTLNGRTYLSSSPQIEIEPVHPTSLSFTVSALWHTSGELTVPIKKVSLLLLPYVQATILIMAGLLTLFLLWVKLRIVLNKYKNNRLLLHYSQQISQKNMDIAVFIQHGEIVHATPLFDRLFVRELFLHTYQCDIAHLLQVDSDNHIQNLTLTLLTTNAYENFHIEIEYFDEHTMLLSLTGFKEAGATKTNPHIQIKQVLNTTKYQLHDSAFVLIRMPRTSTAERIQIINELNTQLEGYQLTLPVNMMYYSDCGFIFEYCKIESLFSVISDIEHLLTQIAVKYYIAVVNELHLQTPVQVLTTADHVLTGIASKNTDLVDFSLTAMTADYQLYQHDMENLLKETNIVCCKPVYRQSTLKLHAILITSTDAIRYNAYPKYIETFLIKNTISFIKHLQLPKTVRSHIHRLHIMLPFALSRIDSQRSAVIAKTLHELHRKDIIYYLPIHINATTHDESLLAAMNIKLGYLPHDIITRPISTICKGVNILVNEATLTDIDQLLYINEQINSKPLFYNIKSANKHDHKAYKSYEIEGSGLVCDYNAEHVDFPLTCAPIQTNRRQIKFKRK